MERVKRLYTSGCSVSAGTIASLPDKKKTWPNLLAKYHGASLVDTSTPGLSNTAIFRKTVEHLALAASKNEIPDMVVIQWTFYDRFEAPLSYAFFSLNVYSFKRSKAKSVRDVGNSLVPDSTRGARQVLSYISALEALFKEYGIDNWKFLIYPPVGAIQDYPIYKVVDTSRILFNVHDYLSEDFEQSEIFKLNGEIDVHFGADAHAQMADWLFNGTELPIRKSDSEVNDIYDYTN